MNKHSTICVFLLALVIIMTRADDADANKHSRSTCEADYKELLASIEFNRIAGTDQINEHLVGVTNEKERARLIDMREKLWDAEEEQRAMATNIRRDCLATAK